MAQKILEKTLELQKAEKNSAHVIEEGKKVAVGLVKKKGIGESEVPENKEEDSKEHEESETPKEEKEEHEEGGEESKEPKEEEKI